MSPTDIRSNELAYNILLLQQEKDNTKKKQLLRNLEDFIHQCTIDNVLSTQKRYLKSKDATITASLEFEMKKIIGQLKIKRLTIENIQPLIDLFSNQKNSVFKRDAAYTEYLTACEAYEQKTGKRLHQNSTDVFQTPTSSEVAASPNNTPTNAVNTTIKPRPVFIDKKEYKDGCSITTYCGFDPGFLETLDETLVKELNQKNANSPERLLTYEKSGNSTSIQGKTEVMAELAALRERRIAEKYNVHSHTTDKTDKKMNLSKHFPEHHPEVAATAGKKLR